MKGDVYMVAKMWKKVVLFVFIVACLFNIVNKLVHRVPLKQELETSARYTYQQQQNNN